MLTFPLCAWSGKVVAKHSKRDKHVITYLAKDFFSLSSLLTFIVFLGCKGMGKYKASPSLKVGILSGMDSGVLNHF